MRFLSIPIAVIILSLFLACSGGGDKVTPVAPDLQTTAKSQTITTSESNHYLWGFWECVADPDSGTLDFTPLREIALHANVVKFLESGAVMKLKISNLSFDGMICDVDVSLTHPFPGLDFYTGFDVAGIFISKGTMSGFNDPDINLAGAGDTRLLNTDGLSRWWNPVEFPLTKTIFGYNDGKLGNKQSVANFDCTLNGYKLFSNDLELDDDILSLDPTDYVTFSPGYTNKRHYTIDFTGGVKFNYAVDANWEPPSGSSPFEPADFPEGAWRPEAWAFSVTEAENSLWNETGDNGGNLSLIIDVWDHFNADLNIITIDSPGNFDPVTVMTPIGGGDGYSTYQIDIVDATPAPNSIDILISAESEIENYGGLLEGKKVTSYFMYTAEVGAQTQSAPVAIMEATTSTDISVDGEVSFDATASTGTPPLTFTWDFNADGTYGGPADTYTGAPETPTHQFTAVGTFNVTVKVSNGAGEDISDPVPVHVGLDPNDIYVDGDYTGGNSDGSPSKPFLTIQEGMNAVTPAHNKVHVDYLDGGTNVYDTASLTLKSNCKLLGDNWNGGGPGKPKADNTTQYWTFGTQYASVSNITIEGFEVGMAEVPENPMHCGFYFPSGGNNITLRYNNITDNLDDTGLSGGPSMPIWMSNCSNSLVEFNDVGPINWHSDTPGEYVRVLWGMYFDTCTSIEVKNNFIHDFTIDYDGDGINWGQIRMFCLHCYACNGADVHNNLICHIKGINDYDYRIEGMMMEGYSGGDKYYYYNNTIDNLDHSQSNGGFMLRGIFCYANSATGSYINNTLITSFKPASGWSSNSQIYFSSPANIYDISYSTGYDLGSVSNYFYNFILGNGCTNSPGINPQYVNNSSQPYNYHFQSGSGCEMGDPTFIDWDDSGSPSGNPGETNIQNRSRMGCFGGPDGDWAPNDL